MTRLFGTDGVRGVANKKLTCEIAYRLGQAAAVFMGGSIVIGKDTRLSGDMLESAAAAGVMSAGGTALLAGIIPTPAVAFLVRELHADGGIVISASHNPPEYNGIKLFDSKGFKLPDEVEDAIESFIEAGGIEAGAKGEFEAPSGDGVGIRVMLDDACERYIEHAVKSVEAQGIDFSGLHIALDAGHGAASVTSARAFEKLGAQVSVVNDDFNGTDINVECGSTCLEPLRELMDRCGADVGIAHDGDADRVILMAQDGTEIDGDFMEALLAIDLHERGLLAHDTVVSTVMCNIGFAHAMREAGIAVVQTKVGDRYVLEEMLAKGYRVGGEQSGHMILLDYNSTGDGLMTACQYLAAVIRRGMTIEDATKIMTRYPQTLLNVKVEDKLAVQESEAVEQAVREAELRLGDDGRVLLRPSGTEPVIRVMVEAKTHALADEMASKLAAIVEAQAV